MICQGYFRHNRYMLFPRLSANKENMWRMSFFFGSVFVMNLRKGAIMKNRFSSLFLIAAVAVGCIISLAGCKSFDMEGEGRYFIDYQTPSEPLYTAFNIWFEQTERIWAANYQKGAFIPAGTPVLRYGLGRGIKYYVLGFDTGGDHPGHYEVFMNMKPFPGRTKEDLIERMFTSKPYKELTKGMSNLELKNIHAGTAEPGMSKAAVLVSFGYPPEIKTPVLERNYWFYWTSRVTKKELVFDSDGVLKSIKASDRNKFGF